MLRQTIMRFALFSFLAAILAWGGVGYLIWDTMQGIQAHSDQSTTSRTSASQLSNDAHIHALAVSSATDRAQLNDLFQTDIVSIVNIIETAGTSGKSSTQITDASQPVPTNKGTSPVHAIVFTTQTDGSFSALIRALGLFETLPIPSTVEQIDLVRVDGGENVGAWHMNARIRVLTTSNISS